MEILNCKCLGRPFVSECTGLTQVICYSVGCSECKEKTPAFDSVENAIAYWNKFYGKIPIPTLCLKCGLHPHVKDGTLCAGCMRKLPMVKVNAPTVGGGLCEEPQSDFFAAVAAEVEYSAVRHPWHNLRPGQIYDALKGENLELADAMLTEDYRQIMTEATHVAGMCKRIYEQAREAMRKKRVAG